MPQKTLGPFIGGINNRSDSSRLPVRGDNGSVRSVRGAVNVNVNNEGSFSSIDTPLKIFSGVGLRDGWGGPAGAFFRQGTTIKKFNNEESTTVITQNITGHKIAWCYADGIVYFSDGIVSKKIYSDNSVTNWGISPPVAAPNLSGVGVYGLGQYMACYTYVAADGTESGSSPVMIVENSGKVVSNMHTSQDRQVVAKRIYITTPNGDAFFHAGTVLPGTAVFEITGDYRMNGTLHTRNKIKPPAGQIIRQFCGHIMIASGSIIWWTDEFSHDLVSFGELDEGLSRMNFWQFPSTVTMMEPVEGGVWIVADKTYFVSGKNPNEAEPIIRSDGTAVPGTSVMDGGNVIWMSDDGEVIGSPGGELSSPQAKNVAVDRAVSGAAIIMESNGIRRKVTSLKNTTPHPLRNKGWKPFMVME